MGDPGDLPRGCAKYPNRSPSKKLCATLNKSTYRKITYPLIRKVFDMKKQKWNAVMSPEEQEIIRCARQFWASRSNDNKERLFKAVQAQVRKEKSQRDEPRFDPRES